MPFELRARLGVDSGEQRFVDEDESNVPEDVSNPRTIRDESQPTLWEKFRSIRWYLAIVSAFGVAFLLYLIAIGSAIVPDLLGNIVIQLALSHSIAIAVVYVTATRSATSRLRDIDWLVLIKPTSLELYVGQFVPAADEEQYHKFAPYRGFSFMGHVKNRMTIEDVNPDLARSWKNANRDPDDPAIIRLDPDFGERVATEYGNVLGQLSNGLRVDTFGRMSNLVATLPDLADESRMDDLKQLIESERENVAHYEELAETYRQQRDDVLEKARRPLDEQVDEAISWGERVAEAGRRRSWEDEEPGDVPPVDNELESMSEGES